MLITIIFSIIFYFLGSFPTSYILGKKIQQIDILTQGSMHSGLSNIYKFSSKKSILLILFVDVLIKGFVPTSLLIIFFDELIFISVFLIIGHNWSVFLKFKGGKGLSVSIGILAGINIFLFIILFVSFLFFWIILKFKDSSMPWIFSFLFTVAAMIFDSLFFNLFSESIFKMSNYLVIVVFLLLLFRRILGNGEYNNLNRKILFNRLIFDRDEM
ncbi:MAG: hypothetical protein CL772_04480 [Chloroflexi bacterium]|nr:hypothetical protein [Chloroflexota bacterium]|tara:strand:+ start:47798 stop:48439 length:642 start_codon:yes stop_codon:yes gene_type:complete